MEVEVPGTVEGAADSDLDGPPRVDETLLHRPAELGSVEVLGAEVLVPGIRVGVEMDQSHRSVSPGNGPENRQGHRVVSSHRDRDHAVPEQALDLTLHRLVGPLDGDRNHVHVAVVGDPELLEGRDVQDWIPGTDQGRLIADRARPEAGARSVGRAAIVGDPDQPDVQPLGVPNVGQAHEGRRLAEPRRPERVERPEVVHPEGLVETKMVWAAVGLESGPASWYR